MSVKSTSKICTVILAVIFILATVAGCGNTGGQQDTTTAAQTGQSESVAANAGGGSPALPLTTGPVTLTYWTSMQGIEKYVKDLNDLPQYKDFEAKTGVHIDFKVPTTGSEDDQYKLMIASSNLPDIIEYGSAGISGQQQGWAVNLSGLIDKDCPNLKKILDGNSALRKEIDIDGGVYVFPETPETMKTMTYSGPVVRQDWLDKLGLQPPETIDDWYNMLTAFKNNDPDGNGKNDTIPFTDGSWGGPLSFTFGSNCFMGAWGVGGFTTTSGFYNEGGKVVYTPIQPQFKDFLSTMNKWYKEGLIDPDAFSNNYDAYTKEILKGNVGSWTGYSPSHLRSDFDSNGLTNVKMLAVTEPVLNKGDKPLWGHLRLEWDPLQYGAVITTSNKYPDLTAKWFDYTSYSDFGVMEWNYGQEGVTYTMVDGKPVFTGTILKNPDGLAPSDAIMKYTRGTTMGPSLYLDDQTMQLFFNDPESRVAFDTWAKPTNEKVLPKFIFSADESAKMSKAMGDINTYEQEMVTKLITGVDSIDNFSKYVDTINKMGINDVISIYQQYLDKYNSK